MKAIVFVFAFCFFDGFMLGAEEASPGTAAVQPIADIPKEYEIGEKSLSPNGRFAILYPIRGDDSAELPPNLLVCLKPVLSPDTNRNRRRPLAGRARPTAGEMERQLNRRDLDRSKMGDEGSGDLRNRSG